VVILPEHRWAEDRHRWVRAEELGFDHAWTYDQLMWRWLRDDTWFGTVPVLAAAAAVTSRITLGTMVATPSFRHPVPFAKELMTLDDISGGRFVCGLGAGAGGADEEAAGGAGATARTAGQRAERFAEFVELADRLLREPTTTHRGRYYTTRDTAMRPGCVQRPRLPFAVAATGPRGMRLAARHAATWITAGTPGRFDARPWREALPVVRAQLDRLDEACAAEGRDPATLDRLLLTGAEVGGVLDSADAHEDAEGAFGELGVTDLVVHWPRAAFPYEARPGVLDRIAERLARRTPVGAR
jgi:alkanesulfonate monooxygenase SsuD/methylene tetrahydromethanopterin reductase-like flavin-dependent oxidoreductase (luciferase family)